MCNRLCTNCARGETAKTVCLWGKSVEPQCKLMVVAEMPSQEDDTKGEPFSGDNLVKDVFSLAMNVPLDDIYFTYLVKCFGGAGTKTTQNEISACYSYLVDEIVAVNPEVVVCLGENAFNFLCGDKGIAKKHGMPYELSLKSFGIDKTVDIIPTFAAGYIAHNDNKLKDFAEDLSAAYDLSRGGSVQKGIS